MKKTKLFAFLLTLILSTSAVSLFAEGQKQSLTPSFGAIGAMQMFTYPNVNWVSGGPTLGLTYEYKMFDKFSVGAKVDLLVIVGFIMPVVPEAAAVLGYDFTDDLSMNINLGWATWGAGFTFNKVHNVNLNLNLFGIPSTYFLQLSYGYKFLF